MANPDRSTVPTGRAHLDPGDRDLLIRVEGLVDAGAFDAAHDLVEDLWAAATGAHRELYQGLANAIAAACAREQGKLRGAAEIAARTHSMLAGFPRTVLELDLDALLESVDRFVHTGTGPVILRRSP